MFRKKTLYEKNPEKLLTNTGIAFTQGPRFKGEATQQFENLIKDILQSHHEKNDIRVSFNSLSEMVIHANQHTYNLTQLLKHQPDFEQLQFNESDISKYDAFLRNPSTVSRHIELGNDTTLNDLENMKNIFPHLSSAEMSAIREYTGNFWAPIYYLFKFNAQKPFPKTKELAIDTSDLANSLIGILISLAKKSDPDYNPNKILNYELNDTIIFNSLIKELLLLTSIAANALSKTQSELNLFTATTYSELEKNVSKISGIALALVQAQNENIIDFVMVSNETPEEVDGFVVTPRESVERIILTPEPIFRMVIIGYGKIINEAPQLIDLKELLAKENAFGFSFSEIEIKEVFSQIYSGKTFNSLENISSTIRTKLIDILMDYENTKNLMSENIYHYEEDAKYFDETYVSDITEKIGTENSFQFIKSFCSTSNLPLDQFKSSGVNILTCLINRIGFVKNIESISIHRQEAERLLIPGQQIAYTHIESKTTTDSDGRERKDINLYGFPIRSIDGMNPFSYSHKACLFREKAISLSDASEKNVSSQPHEVSSLRI